MLRAGTDRNVTSVAARSGMRGPVPGETVPMPVAIPRPGGADRPPAR